MSTRSLNNSGQILHIVSRRGGHSLSIVGMRDGHLGVEQVGPDTRVIANIVLSAEEALEVARQIVDHCRPEAP